MRKLTVLSVLACMLLIATLPACTFLSQPVKAPDYHTAEEICQLPVTNNVLGISPDGGALVLDNRDSISACRLDGLSGSVESLEPYARLEINPGDFDLLNRKQLQWTSDGRSFVFTDAMNTPYELVTGRRMNFSLCTLTGSGITAKRITDEEIKSKITQGGRLIYSASLAPGDRSLVYTARSTDGIDICTADVQSGKREVVYHTDDKIDTESIALGNSVFLCLQNGYKRFPNGLFLQGAGQRVISQIQDDALGLEDNSRVFDIESWSDDRKTVLLARYVQVGNTGYQVDCYFILKMSQDYRSCQVAAFPLGAGGEKRYGMSAALSPDGSYFVQCEFVYSLKDSAQDNPSKKYLVLYNIADGRRTELYSSNEPFGASSPLNGGHEALFLTKNGRMLVWFTEGYKLFQLK